MIQIRNGSQEEIEKFNLYNEDNDGEEILVAVDEQGEVQAFAQITGQTIFFIESLGGGAGTAIVDYLKSINGYLVADNCVRGAHTYWERQGFTQMAPHWGRPSKDWAWEEA